MEKPSIDLFALLVQLYADQEGVEIKIHKEEKTNERSCNC